MNRRKFIRQGSFAAIAIAGLPKAVLAGNQSAATYYKSEDNLKAGQLIYGISFLHATIEKPTEISAENNFLTLGIKYFATTDRLQPTKTAEIRYIIEDAALINNTEYIRMVNARFDKKISGDYDIPKELRKKIKLNCKLYYYCDLLGKKDNVLSHMVYLPPASSGASSGQGCFLTTACVHHKQLPDNCPELEALRFLRNRYMLNTTEGKQLISEYQILGPLLVNTIGKFANHAEIYEYMYHHMILPAVVLVKKGNYKRAIRHYKHFVTGLQKAYLFPPGN